MTQPHPVQRVVSRMLEGEKEAGEAPEPKPPESIEDVLEDVAQVLAEQKAQHHAWMGIAAKADAARSTKRKMEYEIEITSMKVIRGEVPDSALDPLLTKKAKAEAILVGERLANHESRQAEQKLRPRLLEAQARLAAALDHQARDKGLDLLMQFHEWRNELLKPLSKVEGVKASNGSAFLDYVMNETKVLRSIERVLQGLGEV